MDYLHCQISMNVFLVSMDALSYVLTLLEVLIVNVLLDMSSLQTTQPV